MVDIQILSSWTNYSSYTLPRGHDMWWNMFLVSVMKPQMNTLRCVMIHWWITQAWK